VYIGVTELNYLDNAPTFS